METKIVVCTAKYSDNLGDGVISDCVEYLIGKLLPEARVISLDISGRQGFNLEEEEGVSLSKRVFFNTPNFLKPLITLTAWFLIFRPRLKSAINSIDFSDTELLVFGGGQLINDVALNFPLKVSFIAKEAQKNNLNYTFNAIGVGQKLSYWGRLLFNRVFSSPSFVGFYTRDKESEQRFDSLFKSAITSQLTYDSALWSKECYQVTKSVPIQNTKFIGVGVSHPKELSSHVNDSNDDLEIKVEFWIHIIKELLSNGLKPVLFTNGSRDDHAFMQQVVETLKSLGLINEVQVSQRCHNPKELVDVIAEFSGIISHRLHANIVAHALGIPSVALTWDKKVQSYFDLIDRGDCCFNDTSPPNEIVARLRCALQEGINEELFARLKKTSLEKLKEQIGLA